MMTDKKATVGVNKSTVVDPGRAVPVRIKKKTLKKLTDAEKLEADNKKMEERLKQLRQTIDKEKKERKELNNHQFLWKSGKTGPVVNHAKAVSAQNKVSLKSQKVKVKFLSDSVDTKAETKKPVRSGTPHNTFNNGKTWAEVQRPRTSRQTAHLETTDPNIQHQHNNEFEVDVELIQRQYSIVGPICGQCEINPAHVNCIECGEKYCSDCFSVFHKKGALKSHRTRPLTKMMSERQVEIASPKTPIPENSLWGKYNEEDSAQGFAQALAAWRGVNVDSFTTDSCKTNASGCIRAKQDYNKAVNINDSSQTSTPAAIPEIKFTENKDISYFEKIMLKKQKQDTSTVLETFDSLCSPGEITISQLDFCRDLLKENMATESGLPVNDHIMSSESNVLIEEVNAAIGYLNEQSECLIDDYVAEYDSDDDIASDMEIAKQLLRGNMIKIEEFSGTPIQEFHKTNNLLYDDQSDSMLESICENIISSRELSLEPYLNDCSQSNCIQVSQSPPKTIKSKVIDIEQQSIPPSSPLSRKGRYTTTHLSPLVKRIPSYCNLEKQNTLPIQSSKQPQKHNFFHNRPTTADVVILSSDNWKQSFAGFLKAGLPGYQIHNEPKTENKRNIMEENEEITIGGPPSWCPGESQIDNKIFQSQENIMTLSLAKQKERIKNILDIKTSPNNKNEYRDDIGDDNLEYDSTRILDDLMQELKCKSNNSNDLGDFIHSIRNGTPEPISLLSHDDRMAQLDLESRGMTPTVTPLISKITTRESLFDDFEEIEKQIIDENDY